MHHYGAILFIYLFKACLFGEEHHQPTVALRCWDNSGHEKNVPQEDAASSASSHALLLKN